MRAYEEYAQFDNDDVFELPNNEAAKRRRPRKRGSGGRRFG